MNDKLRQSLIGLIWPGPIAGPLPINLFRVLSILFVAFAGPIIASLVMAAITTACLIWYFGLLELTGGKKLMGELLARLPHKLREGIETKEPVALFFSSFFTGVFPYAILLKLLKYPRTTSEILLGVSTLISSFVWTGLFWGGVIEIIKRAAIFAF
jgi:hypothetical protein